MKKVISLLFWFICFLCLLSCSKKIQKNSLVIGDPMEEGLLIHELDPSIIIGAEETLSYKIDFDNDDSPELEFEHQSCFSEWGGECEKIVLISDREGIYFLTTIGWAHVSSAGDLVTCSDDFGGSNFLLYKYYVEIECYTWGDDRELHCDTHEYYIGD